MICPHCKTPGAYVGFNSIECKNSKCKHFEPTEEVICPCCGISGHMPKPEYDVSVDLAAPASKDGTGVVWTPHFTD